MLSRFRVLWIVAVESTQPNPLRIQTAGPVVPLQSGGHIAAAASAVTGIVLLVASIPGWPLGLPTCIAGLIAGLCISVLKRLSSIRCEVHHGSRSRDIDPQLM